MHALAFYAGPLALAHVRRHGLRAADVGIVPAAAGGPKGLIFQSLDQWLFGHWLPAAPRSRTLIGASIGAWRMAAACHVDPVQAFARLGELYCAQRYSARPSPREIDGVCQQLLTDFLGGHEPEILAHPDYRLQLLTVRGRSLLRAPVRRAGVMAGFAAAALVNLASRSHLSHLFERVVVGDGRDTLAWMHERFDAFSTHFCTLSQANLRAALLASGTLPLVMAPVRAIPGAPDGLYWDGGMVDYHLALPYARAAPDLVLYPHFTQHIVPGWLDKTLAWRRMANGPQRHWLDNVLIVAPSDTFVRNLPQRRLPDRRDFSHYGADYAARARQWQHAIGEGERLADEFEAFTRCPDPARVRAL